MIYCNSLHGRLNKLAELGLSELGSVTSKGLIVFSYMKVKDFFKGSTEKYAGVSYGLDVILGQNSLE